MYCKGKERIWEIKPGKQSKIKMDYYKSKNNSINILFRKTDIKHKKKQSENVKSSSFQERKIGIKGVGQDIVGFFFLCL